MSSITIKRQIAAPLPKVFTTVATIDEFSKALPHITKVEILSDVKNGVGTRFIETRLMRGREASTELEVTEYVEDEKVRLVSDAGGVIWDTVFTVRDNGTGTDLEMVMDAKPYKLLSRLITPLVMKTIAGAIERDMDAVKDYCESSETAD